MLESVNWNAWNTASEHKWRFFFLIYGSSHRKGRIKSETLSRGQGTKLSHPTCPPPPSLAGKRLPRERNFRVLIKGSWCNPTRLKLQPVTLQARESSSPREAKLSQHRPYFVSVYGLLGNLIRARDARESPSFDAAARYFPVDFFFIRPSKKIIPAQSGGSVSPATAGSRERTDRFRDITTGALQESDFIKLIHLFLYLSVINLIRIYRKRRESLSRIRDYFHIVALKSTSFSISKIIRYSLSNMKCLHLLIGQVSPYFLLNFRHIITFLCLMQYL